MAVFRVYTEKKKPYAVEADALLHELRSLLGIESLRELRVVNRYDVQGADRKLFERCVHTVFAEPQLDDVYFELPGGADGIFAIEYLPGQFDARASGAEQCIQLLSGGARPRVASARVFLLFGELSQQELCAIKKYMINPVEARESALEMRDSLEMRCEVPTQVKTIDGFRELDGDRLGLFVASYGLAMDSDDLAFCRDYFMTEQRDPTVTELRMIDTYWSDHCRHTTFNTHIENVKIEDPLARAAYERYLALREMVGRADKPVTLMDIATAGKRYLEKTGELKNLDDSEEINACSVKIKADVNGSEEDWLLLFKNETHNHPTEIEPFGGAATCIGGAIRDPLANRGYVYQAMRVTGAGNPLVPVRETLPGKLPQHKIVTTAAAGYSSYGNQIGLATGLVDEIYHDGYIAKRMEIGAVVGAVRESNVRRETPNPGDVVILLGGRTGRDGCGGATGSSKPHGEDSLASCGAEVQKGNAPEERKLQRLFRDRAASRMIKRCNDFGAGGVSVAVGELADGLDVNLDAVTKKYDGLDGTELAISESQERMAVVVEAGDAAGFIELAARENIEASVVATVTEQPHLVMRWNGAIICDVKRSFLDTNGAKKHADVVVNEGEIYTREMHGSFAERMQSLVGDLNVCSKKGLSERFDSTIGAASVLMPFGGRTQRTPSQAMAAKLPVGSETTTCSGMAWGFDPFVAEKSEYRGGYLAVVESVAKLVASGFERRNIYLTFQEYFKRLGNDPQRWGSPFASLLGALDAQLDLKVAAIGGKDSMSGSFENLDVPPTLVSFAVAAGNTGRVQSCEFKRAGSRVALISPDMRDALLPGAESLKKTLDTVEQIIANGKALSVYALGARGVAEAIFKMSLGNEIGFKAADDVSTQELFSSGFGSFLLELDGDEETGRTLGYTSGEYVFEAGEDTLDLRELERPYEDRLAPVFPFQNIGENKILSRADFAATGRISPKITVVRPRVLIPVFPGTNCELDSARAMNRAGANPTVYVIRNLTPADVERSVADVAHLVSQSEIVFLPGGFSGADEPEGSAKLIAAFFRNPVLTQAVRELLFERDGLMLGICNGFQALLKLGLLPFGDICETDVSCPTLTFNKIGRHQSKIVRTRICSTISPWLASSNVGDIKSVAVSHGEGRFVGSHDALDSLAKSGQIAAQYVDLAGEPTSDSRYNPNGSMLAVEALSSPDGRILGKMGHSERSGRDLYKNVEGDFNSGIFESGVEYFKI